MPDKKPKLPTGVFEKETPAIDKPHLPNGIFKKETVSFKDKIIAVLMDIAKSLRERKPHIVNIETPTNESPREWELKKIDKKTWILKAR